MILCIAIIFFFQVNIILNDPVHIILINVPPVIQTFLIFIIAYLSAKARKLQYCIAVSATMIGVSDFLELAAAETISLFGLRSGATPATVAGVLVEMPMMLILVKIVNKTKHWFSGTART
ncbi:MAG: hypothetical protein PHQ09_03175 [Actinomycetota bacterium]|nr:hypothetical protein [Actinomycetota bacterium]